MFGWFKRKKKNVPATDTIKPLDRIPVPMAYVQKNYYEDQRRKAAMEVEQAPQAAPSKSEDGGFLTSLLAADVGGTEVGLLVGGDLAGSLIGGMLHDEHQTDEPQNDTVFGGGSGGGGGAEGDYTPDPEPEPTPDDSDYSSNDDSGSSGGDD